MTQIPLLPLFFSEQGVKALIFSAARNVAMTNLKTYKNC